MRRLSRRKRLSMTSLIDIIFLLLLFFMLTSTFTKFAEVDLTSGGSGASVASGPAPVFLQLSQDEVRVNGSVVDIRALEDALTQLGEPDKTTVLVALDDAVTAQRLTDLLVSLKSITGLSVTVLGAA